MSNSLNLRKTSQDFRRLSSNLLRTKDADGLAYVKRFYDFINQDAIIKQYIDDACNASEYDCNNFIIIDGITGQRRKFNIPNNEIDHVKAMYDLLESLLNHEPPIMHLSGLSRSFNPSISNYNQSIQAFLDNAFKPLINYINDSLSKEMMSLEQTIPNVHVHQTIEKVYGTANAGPNIQSVNYSNHQQNNFKELTELLSVFRAEIENSSLDAEEKEFAVDDLRQIKEQIESDTPDLTRIKKAKNGIKNFLAAVATKAAATVVVSNAPSIIEKGTEFLNRLGQHYPMC